MTNTTHGADHDVHGSAHYICPTCGHKWLGYESLPKDTLAACNGLIAGNQPHKWTELKVFEDD